MTDRGPGSGRQVYQSPEPRRFQATLVSAGILSILPGLAAAVLYLLPPADDAAALLASFIPYAMVVDLIALLGFGIALIRARQRIALSVLTGLSALLLILQLSWAGPAYLPDDRPAAGPGFTVLSLNLRYGEADLEQVADRSREADLVILVEVTPELRPRIADRLGARFPYQVPGRVEQPIESLILSRYRLSDPQPIPSLSPDWMATAELPGLGPTRVIGAHPCNPLCGDNRWQREHDDLFRQATRAGRAGPVIMAGDFNATDEHGPVRRLQRAGFATAVDLAGAGWVRTFPANHRLLPPLIGIDHILVTEELTATSVRTVRVAGTDHLGLVADLAPTDRA